MSSEDAVDKFNLKLSSKRRNKYVFFLSKPLLLMLLSGATKWYVKYIKKEKK